MKHYKNLIQKTAILWSFSADVAAEEIKGQLKNVIHDAIRLVAFYYFLAVMELAKQRYYCRECYHH